MRAKSFLVKVYSLFFGLALLLGACVPEEKQEFTEVNRGLGDETVRHILNLQNRQVLDSLLGYFSHSNPTYRYYAARAFGSFQNENVLDSLHKLLADPNPEVKAVAAFSIGQIGAQRSEQVLTSHFVRDDTSGIYAVANSIILEAVGKCGTARSLNFLATITYHCLFA